MTSGGRRGGRNRTDVYAVTTRMQGATETVTAMCTCASLAGAISVILAAMLDPKQRHKLLTADRTKNVSWVRAAIEHLMAADPDMSLDEVEQVIFSMGRATHSRMPSGVALRSLGPISDYGTLFARNLRAVSSSSALSCCSSSGLTAAVCVFGCTVVGLSLSVPRVPFGRSGTSPVAIPYAPGRRQS
jgi:hypothetical protein